jgi:hypothetical protein
VPPDAAVLAGSIPTLIVQRKALPVRNGKVGLGSPFSMESELSNLRER